MTRERDYVFTLNNYTKEEYESILKIKCKYLIVGKEKGESGTPHLQGYVYFANAKTFSAVKKAISKRAHIEKAEGTALQNRKYCSKDKDYVEIGEIPKQGSRNDLSQIKENCENNIKIKKQLKDNHICNYQQLKFAEGLMKYYEVSRNWKPVINWYYGATGTGKTRRAYEEALSMAGDVDNIYFAMDTCQWFDGYDGEEYIIIDDIRKDFAKFHTLLKLFDRYPYRVQTKGSTRQFLSKVIWVTCPYSPQVLYSGREDINQLLRRLTLVEQLGEVLDKEVDSEPED